MRVHKAPERGWHAPRDAVYKSFHRLVLSISDNNGTKRFSKKATLAHEIRSGAYNEAFEMVYPLKFARYGKPSRALRETAQLV